MQRAENDFEVVRGRQRGASRSPDHRFFVAAVQLPGDRPELAEHVTRRADRRRTKERPEPQARPRAELRRTPSGGAATGVRRLLAKAEGRPDGT